MRKFFIAITILALGISACSPKGEKEVWNVESASLSDTIGTRSYLTVNLDLPVSGPGAEAIRTDLLDTLRAELNSLGFDTPYDLPAYSEGKETPEDVLSFYFPLTFQNFLSEYRADSLERMQDIDAEELSEQELEYAIPSWGAEISLKLLSKTDRYAVFQSDNYVFYSGAHGGMGGAGCMTYDLKDGHKVTSFIKEGALSDLQPLLEEGLREYFSDALEDAEDVRDVITTNENGLIPLPAWTPYPCEDGLAFTYQQYEIAPYAYGMPCFSIAYDKVAPYLTDEAKTLLGL